MAVYTTPFAPKKNIVKKPLTKEQIEFRSVLRSRTVKVVGKDKEGNPIYRAVKKCAMD